jgi:hypothetical protein
VLKVTTAREVPFRLRSKEPKDPYSTFLFAKLLWCDHVIVLLAIQSFKSNPMSFR